MGVMRTPLLPEAPAFGSRILPFATEWQLPMLQHRFRDRQAQKLSQKDQLLSLPEGITIISKLLKMSNLPIRIALGVLYLQKIPSRRESNGAQAREVDHQG